MAGRLPELTSRCIFCTFNATKSLPVFTHRLPGTVGTVRFRSSKTKPPLHLLAQVRHHNLNPEQSKKIKPLSAKQLYNITNTLLQRIAPPSLELTQKFYNDSNTSPNEWYNGLQLPAKSVQKAFYTFHDDILRSLKESDFLPLNVSITTRAELENAINERGGLGEYLKFKFLEYIRVIEPRQGSDVQLKKAADLRFPQEWYPVARQFQRTWYLHVGPTNSGKTYHALQRLMQSGSGWYAGPLRLLAHEVYERMNAQGVSCNLVTGDDRKVVSPTATLTSSTVEMVDLNKRMEVCVLDEIQMIGDTDRGWAWTQALLGVKAQEVHLCGEERTVQLIQNLANTMGDKLVVRHYNRLGPLEVMDSSLRGDLSKLEKGDCVVTFSRKNIFALQREIETQTGRKCAVIYGSLPPETRSLQARLFNDPDTDYEILVASDAVGMGLNLSIKRMIFETTIKFNGVKKVPISVPAIKQIAGRAGRYRVPNAKTPATLATPAIPAADTVAPLPAAPSVGLVTSLEQEDYGALKYAMSVTPKPIKTAGILPSSSHIEHFANLLPPSTPFHKVLERLREYSATTNSLFHLCSFDDHLEVAHAISKIKGLSVTERLRFCMAPISKDFMVQEAALEMAQKLANSEDGSALSIQAFDLEVLDIENPARADQLRRLEGLHKALLLYLWLSWRFPSTFGPRETAQALKTICEEKIGLALKNLKIERKKHTTGNIQDTLAAEENEDEDEDEELDFDDTADTEEEGESVIPHESDENLIPASNDTVVVQGFVPDDTRRLSRQMSDSLEMQEYGHGC